MRVIGAIWLMLLTAGCAGGLSGSSTGTGTAPAGQERSLLQNVLAARLSYLMAAVKGLVPEPDGGRITPGATLASGAVPELWRQADAVLYLRAQGPADPQARFFFPAAGARKVDIALHAVSAIPGPARITCDGPARLKGAPGTGTGWRAAGDVLALTLQKGQAQNPHLLLSPEVTNCRIGWGEGRHVSLMREDLGNGAVAALDTRQQLCAAPDPAGLDPLAQVFYADRWLMQSCVQPLGQVRLLPDPLDALNARIEALTGARLSRAALMSGDPMQKLDFRHAPKLDLIYVSYLHIRADYSGYLVARMLAWHASRGTIVRILVTDRLMLGAERRLLSALAAQYPNIQIQYFQWRKTGPKDVIYPLNRLQRSQHVKVFATVASQPGRSRYIVGGRNIHDGFFFAHPFDLSAYPFLRTYEDEGAQDLAFYSVYQDFEIELSDDRTVRAGVAELSAFWHRDGPSDVARPVTATGPRREAATGGLRFFLSLPWVDGAGQEKLYVELIDAAQREVVMVSPYLYPPVAVEAALLRARARGVTVRIVTRLDSSDPPGMFIQALSQEFVARHAGEMEIFEYKPAGKMLHTKLVLIDGRLSVVTSTNLNRRSFQQDSENGVMVMDRGFTARLRQVVDGYLALAQRQEGGGELNLLSRGFRALPWFKQFF